MAVATFSLAVASNRKNENGEKEADFINIVAWKKQAETINQYLSKGSKVAIEGRIQTRSYDDQKGNKHYVTEVISENIEFLDTKKTEEKSKVDSNPFQEFANEHQEDFKFKDEEGYDLPF